MHSLTTQILGLGTAAFLAFTTAASAQTGLGSISGHIIDSQGLAVAGVTVTVQSPALQRMRVAHSSANGDYLVPLLPPGSYRIEFELSGFATLMATRDVAATEPVTVNATMTPAPVGESVHVIARGDMFVNAVQSATNIRAATLAMLPTNRSLLAAVDLASGVHATAPAGRAPTISGGMSFENAFMLNGAQITDNITNAPLSLFIEDAIQEVTTTTAGISSEYGRFTGGAVNAITKSGGNLFSGSLRTTLTDDNWRSTSPLGEPKTADVVPTYEFTVGGPILMDRTWYFGAGRLLDDTVTKTLGVTAVPYQTRDNEKRFEAKLTQSLGNSQSVTIAYSKIDRTITNAALPNPAGVMDLRSLTDYRQPQDLVSVHYAGGVGSTLFLEAQAISRNFSGNRGGTTTDRLQGTLIFDGARGNLLYWAPPFCSVCGDDSRDSTEWLAKGTYFVSTPRGAHDIVFGYDTFNDNVLVDNHQSASDYLVSSTTSVIRDGRPYPVFKNDGTTFLFYQPILVPSLGWNFRTHALFLNDTLRYNKRFTFKLGVRWDRNHGTDAAGGLIASGSAVSPRLGIAWDVKGDGRWTVVASFSKYVAAVIGPVGNAGSPAGRPATFPWNYGGPAVNANANGPLVPPAEALQILFNWFDSLGGTSLRPYGGLPNIPGLTTRIDGSLDSPNVVEYAGGVSRRLGARGALRADLTYRDYRDFYATVTNLSTGRVTSREGQVFDLSLIENTNAVRRRYAGLMIQSNMRPDERLDIGGNYTLSRLWGTFDGESILGGPGTTGVHSFPEYFDPRWNSPEGDLAADQRHRLRLWSTCELPGGNTMGRFTLAALERIESGTPYGAVGRINSRPFVVNPGYVNPPMNVSYFFTARDEFRTETMMRTDLSINYASKLGGSHRHELFAQVQLLNLFNQSQLVDLQGGNIDVSVLTPATGGAPYQAFNPFTAVPVRGVNWDFGPNFGRALGPSAYTLPRTFLVTFGVRY